MVYFNGLVICFVKDIRCICYLLLIFWLIFFFLILDEFFVVVGVMVEVVVMEVLVVFISGVFVNFDKVGEIGVVVEIMFFDFVVFKIYIVELFIW